MKGGSRSIRPAGPLHIAVLVKQVPLAEDLELGPERRLRRQGVTLEMNPYCRRGVSKGVELAAVSLGSCTVFTLGPEEAGEVLREAVACGATRGVHLSDPAFAGSDTLATSKALAHALKREGPFDLVLAGRTTTDGDTGQVGPEVAQMLGLPFACGVRELELDGGVLRLRLELEDGTAEVELSLPAVLSVAERLCPPCKVGPEERSAVPDERIELVSAAQLGDGPWGAAASPTVVGAVRAPQIRRERIVLSGEGGGAAQSTEAVRVLRGRGALSSRVHAAAKVAGRADPALSPSTTALMAEHPVQRFGAPLVAVVLEQGRPDVGVELVGAATRLAEQIGGHVVAWRSEGEGRDSSGLGVDEVVDLVVDVGAGRRQLSPEDAAEALARWAADVQPWAVLAPSTSFGREVAARVAAQLGAGLVGDAIGLEVAGGRLVAAKPALSGALVADVTCSSPVQLVTVRPGALPLSGGRRVEPRRSVQRVAGRGRLRTLAYDRDDDVEVLARAEVVIGLGTGVTPEDYTLIDPLRALLGAELAATRKVTDRGWMPHSRQVGLTGRSISPRLYVAVGSSGKFNHMVGVRGAGTVLAINSDPAAPVFGHVDVGIVADWHDAVPHLVDALRAG